MLGAVLVIAGLVGCGGGEQPTSAPAEPTEHTEVVRIALMEEHYVRGMTAHDAVIRGDVAEARAALASLAVTEIPGGPPPQWVPHLDKLHAAAEEASKSEDLVVLGATLGAAGTICADCHIDLGLTPMYPAPAPPEATGALTDTMRRHQWATERLWEGLTAPWELAWTRGGQALAETRIFAPSDAGEPVPGDLAALEEQMRALGTEAGQRATSAERADVYGRLLVTCAACHDKAGVVFPVRPHGWGEG